MKTIEERADKYIGHPFEVDESSPITMARHSYIQGATEQRNIDIDKACEWLKENIYNYIAVGNTDFGKPYDIDLVADELFEDFQKAMEE